MRKKKDGKEKTRARILLWINKEIMRPPCQMPYGGLKRDQPNEGPDYKYDF